MKTPHRIELIYNKSSLNKYDPMTDTYISEAEDKETLPCFVNVLTKAKVFELYGSREDKVIAVRFMQKPKEFVKARYNNETYVHIDEVDPFIKGSIRLKKVNNGY